MRRLRYNSAEIFVFRFVNLLTVTCCLWTYWVEHSIV